MRIRAGWIAAVVACVSAGPASAQPNDDAARSDAAALIAAAKQGDAGAVGTLLQAGVDADAAEADGSTALLWAVHSDSYDAAQLLLEAGADPNGANDLGATPLWAAGENRNPRVTDLLLAAGADPNLALLAGETPVMVAARAGAADVVDRLAGAGADLERRGTRGQTALMWAAAQRHPAVVETLIAHGADLHAVSDVWSQWMGVPPHSRNNKEIPHGGNTALLFAVRAGDLESARLLVDAGADVDDADAWGVSAVTLAAHGGHNELLAFLLERGADPGAAAAGFAALHESAMRNDVRATRALLEAGADPDVRLETWTPTRRASRDLHFPPSFIGATPFWLAARFARAELMQLLAEHGADPRFVLEVEYVADGSMQWRTDRTTALMAALGMGGGRVRPWVPYTDDGTPESRTLAAVKLAVELGADVHAADPNGRTALDVAEELQFESVVHYLVEQGADEPAPR
ncbi:MAG: ankyrin repeat domain-containing protein [Acidobacteria bacterium]|nr:ankyrin repeat domain-containing protein [Acidobacteriota bacterium]MYJ06098.1 ankyrin repeat domain-containing protein [Acidobacteriota bacterium]